MKSYLMSRPLKDLVAGAAFLGVVCLLGFSAYWAWQQFRSTPPYVDPDKYPVRGIDISRHNGDIDFQKVKNNNIDFVFIKASEGKDHKDNLFESNYDKAIEAGLKIGAYHFFRFDSDGIDQALNFLDAVGDREPDLGLVIDVEQTGNPPADQEIVKEELTQMVDYMNLLGYRIMLYTNLEGYYDYMHDIFPGYPLWICRFKENPINAEWTFWQYDHHGKVDGVDGDVDLDAFCGSRDDWERFLNGAVWPYSE